MQSFDPRRNLCAVELVRRAENSAGQIQQPQYYGLKGQCLGFPWVRQGGASSFAEIEAQDARLAEWARGTGNYLEIEHLEDLSGMADLEFKGNEHNVIAFLKRPEPFVIRWTKLDMFGLPGRTPGEYLQRWRLQNAAFPDTAACFLGYTTNARGNGVILTSQRYFEGTKKSRKVLDQAFSKLGFQHMAGGEPSYRNDATGVEIHDAKPDNVIFDKPGNMFPFDVWINDSNDFFGLSTGF